MSTKSSKPKSPPTPSRSLGDCVADVRKLYQEYSHGNFAKSEIASNLGLSATSGPFAARLFTLKAFGLLTQNGDSYSISETFITLNSTAAADSKFKSAALSAVRQSATFRELLDEFGAKLPSVESVAGRLETQKRFNADRAKSAAGTLEKSLQYAGVLDSSNNILPVRDDAGRGAESQHRQEEDEQQRQDPPGGYSNDRDDHHDEMRTGMLSLEIPVREDRTVLVRYPQDLSVAEAKKVGNVLNAVVA
jgi:hypothetical protein